MLVADQRRGSFTDPTATEEAFQRALPGLEGALARERGERRRHPLPARYVSPARGQTRVQR